MDIPLLNIPSDLTSLCACLALLLAAIAGFIHRSNFISSTLVQYWKGCPLLPHPSFQYYYQEGDSCSSSSDEDDDADDDEDDDKEEEVEEEQEEENSDNLSSCSENPDQEDVRPFFWPEIGGAVVKAWDGLGLRSSSTSVSLFDLSRGEILKPFAAATQAAAFVSQAVVLSATVEETCGFSAVMLWDARRSGDSPAATGGYWGPALRHRAVAAVAGGGGDGRVYVRDDAGGVAEVDLRGGSLQAAAAAARWDGKALVVEGGSCGGRRGGSVVSWCRNAAKCLTLLPLPE